MLGSSPPAEAREREIEGAPAPPAIGKTRFGEKLAGGGTFALVQEEATQTQRRVQLVGFRGLPHEMSIARRKAIPASGSAPNG